MNVANENSFERNLLEVFWFLQAAFNWLMTFELVPQTDEIKRFVKNWKPMLDPRRRRTGVRGVREDVHRQRCFDLVFRQKEAFEEVVKEPKNCSHFLASWRIDRETYSLQKRLEKWDIFSYDSGWQMDWIQMRELFLQIATPRCDLLVVGTIAELEALSWLHGGNRDHVILTLGLHPDGNCDTVAIGNMISGIVGERFSQFPTVLPNMLHMPQRYVDRHLHMSGWPCIMDVRNALKHGGEYGRRNESISDILQRLEDEFPIEMDELVTTAVQYILQVGFLFIGCKSGNHRSRAIAKAATKALSGRLGRTFVIHLSSIYPLGNNASDDEQASIRQSIYNIVNSASSSYTGRLDMQCSVCWRAYTQRSVGPSSSLCEHCNTDCIAFCTRCNKRCCKGVQLRSPHRNHYCTTHVW